MLQSHKAMNSWGRKRRVDTFWRHLWKRNRTNIFLFCVSAFKYSQGPTKYFTSGYSKRMWLSGYYQQYFERSYLKDVKSTCWTIRALDEQVNMRQVSSFNCQISGSDLKKFHGRLVWLIYKVIWFNGQLSDESIIVYKPAEFLWILWKKFVAWCKLECKYWQQMNNNSWNLSL